MIIPEGIDLDSLKFLLRRVSDVKLRSLVFYFCGNKDDVRTENGFIFCGDEIKLHYIEENALHTAVFFDSCGSLVSEDYKDTVQEEFFVQDSDGENDALRNIAAGRFLCEDVLEDCANFADGYDYDYEWVLDTFQEQFSKIKRGYLKNKGCE